MTKKKRGRERERGEGRAHPVYTAIAEATMGGARGPIRLAGGAPFGLYPAHILVREQVGVGEFVIRGAGGGEIIFDLDPAGE
jgi:hypothetical protein